MLYINRIIAVRAHSLNCFGRKQKTEARMEAFKGLITLICGPTKVDFIGKLPVEVAHLILENLNNESISSVARVSRRWAEVCRSYKRRRINMNINSRKTYPDIQRPSSSVSTGTVWLTKKKTCSTASYEHLQMSYEVNKLNRRQYPAKTLNRRLRL